MEQQTIKKDKVKKETKIDKEYLEELREWTKEYLQEREARAKLYRVI